MHPEGGGVVLDLDGLAYGLEGVCDLEEKLGWFLEVLHTGGQSGGAGAPNVGEFRDESIEKEGMYQGNDVWAGEMSEQGGANFHAPA
jgi:hypothetical protein